MYQALPEQWAPSEKQKQEAIALVPVNAKMQFIQQRADDRSSIEFTYIRRPAYYATFAGGKQINEKQRLGLGLVWGKAFLMQSSRNKGWGTIPAGNNNVLEAGNIHVTYSSGSAKPGITNIDSDSFSLEYKLGETGKKRIEFGSSSITVKIDYPGDFTEQIPASSSDNIYVDNKQVDKIPIVAKDHLVYTFRF
jgi:hypothetical protein